MLLEGQFKSQALSGTTTFSAVLPEDNINFLAGESFDSCIFSLDTSAILIS